MPPKKQKPDNKLNLQDLPRSVRMRITEFLQPSYRQQNQLSSQYREWKNDELMRRTMEELGWVDDVQTYKEMEEQNKAKYKDSLTKFTKAPGIYETYQYFWDDEYPWPDQDGGTGGGRPITS